MQIIQQTPASKHSAHAGANKFTQRTNLRAGVLEDDHAVRKLYCEALLQEDVVAIPFENAFEMTVAVRANMVDIALIDLGLGSEDGMQIIRDLRVFSGLPILIVSGKTEPETICEGLDCGADDYLRKPFNFSELRARIRNLVRRARATPARSEGGFAVKPVVIDGVRFDLAIGIAEKFGQRCHFTDRESHILQCLLKTPGQAVSRDTISRAIFGEGWDPTNRMLDVHVSNIRTKLEAIGASPRIIRTRRNLGYIINVNTESRSRS